MRISSRGRLAVALMVDVALHRRHGPVPLRALSQRHRVSLSLLESVVANLRRHRLVEATRGPGGGYYLGRTPKSISVADIVFAVDGEMDTQTPDAHDRAAANPQCVTHDLWNGLRQSVVDFLRAETLQALVSAHSPWNTPIARQPATPVAVPAPRPRPVVKAPNSVFDLARFRP